VLLLLLLLLLLLICFLWLLLFTHNVSSPIESFAACSLRSQAAALERQDLEPSSSPTAPSSLSHPGSQGIVKSCYYFWHTKIIQNVLLLTRILIKTIFKSILKFGVGVTDLFLTNVCLLGILVVCVIYFMFKVSLS